QRRGRGVRDARPEEGEAGRGPPPEHPRSGPATPPARGPQASRGGQQAGQEPRGARQRRSDQRLGHRPSLMGIRRYLLRRLLTSAPIVLGVPLITFTLIHTAAGSLVPGVDQLDPQLTAADLARMRHNLGLDQPLWLQYLTWLGGVLHGDWGRSLVDGTPVLTLIFQRLPNTLELTLTAVALAVGLATPLGVISALRRGTPVDHSLTALSVVGVSVPAFWLGLILILVFSVTFHQRGLPALPSQGAVSPIDGGDLLDRILHLLMPATVLAFGYLA